MSFLERQFLIAMPGLDDPNFARGVTLLCQHNDDGALGLTINRPSDFTVMDLLNQIGLTARDPALAEQPVYEGGPVHPERGFVLHQDAAQRWASSIEVGPNLVITSSRDILEAIAEGTGPERFLVALGYAGWSAGQLEAEMRDNAWLTVMAGADIVFDAPIEQRWSQAVAKLGIDVGRLQPAGGHA
jgi:putative transcriptional regulator